MTDLTSNQTEVLFVECADSNAMALHNETMLNIDRNFAATLGQKAVDILEAGGYTSPSGRRVDLKDSFRRAVTGKVSIPPAAPLPRVASSSLRPSLTVSVSNETTLEAARRLVNGGARVLALNFAASTQPGGGFLGGARAQEKALARSSGLYATLNDDPMYDHHKRQRSHGHGLGYPLARRAGIPH